MICGFSEGAGKGGIDRDEGFSPSPTFSVCVSPTGKFSAEQEETGTDCCAGPVDPSELGDPRETGRDGRASRSSLKPAGEAARIGETGG